MCLERRPAGREVKLQVMCVCVDQSERSETTPANTASDGSGGPPNPPPSSWAPSRCWARRVRSHQIHFISNQLQLLALMEGIKESSAAARLSSAHCGGDKEVEGRRDERRDDGAPASPGGGHESPGWRTATRHHGSCAFLSL